MSHTLLSEHRDLATAVDILDHWLAYTLHKNHHPGLAVGIVYDGELLWGKGYGYADITAKKPITLDTRFRIASISKTFTAVSILQLRDVGRLSLDDTASSYLDWFTLRYEDAPPITIRNLLSHTAGLPRDAHKPLWTGYETPTWKEFKAVLNERRPTQPPNNQFAYSNFGYSILGAIIEEVSGQAWADYCQQHILDPLGMTETFAIPNADDERLAKGYSRADEEYQRSPMPFFLMNSFEASANFASSLNDLVKYAGFHLSIEASGVLSPHTLRDMHRIHWLMDTWDGGYGFGTELYRIRDWTISGHSGGYPGYLTQFTLCREHNMAVIALSNAIDSGTRPYVEQSYKLVLPEVIKATQSAQPQLEPIWDSYLGVYANAWSLMKVVIREGQLQLLSLDAVDAPPTVLEPTDNAHIFTLKQANQSNETARFETDETGQVVHFWLRNEISTRVQ